MAIDERIIEEIKTYLKLKEEGHFIVMSNDVFNIKILGETTVIEFKDISLNLDKINYLLTKNFDVDFLLVYERETFSKEIIKEWEKQKKSFF